MNLQEKSLKIIRTTFKIVHPIYTAVYTSFA